MANEIDRLLELVCALKKCRSDRERIKILDQEPSVQNLIENVDWQRLFTTSESHELIIKSLAVIGQGEHCLVPNEKLSAMLEDLVPVEAFYKEMGGLVGYHWTLFSCLFQEEGLPNTQDVGRYHRPPGIDISCEDDRVRTFILEGIISLPLLAEIYPVGGAADRLKFFDPETRQPLPAAKLLFCGFSLLEGLIRDVQAREYLYFKLFGEQVTIPIAMMTSSEKDNDRHIVELCIKKNWFGRSKDSFRFFCQPVVPTMDKQGKWCTSGPMKLLMKPGGHGVIWKVAKEEGIFDWVEDLGCKKILVRQINNPIAGVDYGLLAFCGVGFREEKLFGFSSCPRQVQSAEGVNILIERSPHYCLTSIEYCDFPKFSIEDVPVETGSQYSQFPSNTNILFADIAALKRAVVQCPIPGMLVNLKKISFTDEEGYVQEQEVARLESTMQNIADCFEESIDPSLFVQDLPLSTYLTYNHRRKTIATTKKLFQSGASLLETPEGCFYDMLHNAHDLLTQYCRFTLPALPALDTYIHQGPTFLFGYHPALGPLFSIIAQKMRGGKMWMYSELKLEIAEVDIAHLNLRGSLHITADQVMGEVDGTLHYSEQVGRCRLINVAIENRGFDPHAQNIYWKGEIHRLELCEIVIHGDGEFIAENVILRGSMRIEVTSGTRLTAFDDCGELKFKEERRSDQKSSWAYHLADDGSILLE